MNSVEEERFSLRPRSGGVETSEARSWVAGRRPVGWGVSQQVIWQLNVPKHPPPVTSFAALSMCRPPHRFAGGGRESAPTQVKWKTLQRSEYERLSQTVLASMLSASGLTAARASAVKTIPS